MAELEAATDVYGGRRDNVPGAGGNVRASPLLTLEQKKALKMDPHPARSSYLARSFLQIIKDRRVRSLNLLRGATKHWSLAQLGTTFKFEDMRNQAVMFDITDLDNISMGVLRRDRAGRRECASWKTGLEGPVQKMLWPIAMQVPEAPPKLAVTDCETLINLILSDVSDDGYIGLVDVWHLTAGVVAAALADSAIFSGPNDRAGFEAMTSVIRHLPRLRSLYIAEPPHPGLTVQTRARELQIQEAFGTVFEAYCPPHITLGMTIYSSECANWLQL
ncbi:hypothetical protein LEL_08779 [Akanthomyces lecanii RCEF 1005]|uniref:Uncharacterized protein n=1 Tax=Akanthomyces lecanii RCEF 1005 TaxID=1081108 RepID=A0A168DTQ0_CORDF|nr:hypothetical protein LEL_08779 [Akanthomyces lecanii RCEF 1005]